MSVNPPPDFGYYFTPRPGPGLHAHTRLELRLRQEPSGEHFDPELVHLAVIQPAEESGLALAELSVSHPWPQAEGYMLACGPLTAADRFGREAAAFTFGGQLRIEAGENLTRLLVDSPAPIFELTAGNPFTELFIDEVEIVLAMRRAAWLETPGGYERRITAAEPQALYAACLLAVRARLAALHDYGSPLITGLAGQINNELETLQPAGELASHRGGLEELL